ncbi:MAG: FKBP-type peptidyl-prolyl cis-trans isomerase [Bacteroidales bacterium]|jgi:FKBP-type peptidyl-prolyl cis-trans isomerase|nr:FKBP-type peptidyl-prolyl cis-trans isomerase [Bacteroidales bacterium]
MKKSIILASVFAIPFICGIMTACSQKKSHVDLGELKDLKDSASYVLGYSNGMQAHQQQVEINPEIFAKAFRQGYNNDTTGVLSQEQMQNVIEKYSRQSQEKQQKQAMEKAKPNIARAEKFLAANKNQSGVITTSDGLQYKIIKKGTGATPKLNDRVKILYSLSTLDANGNIKKLTSDFDNPKTEPHLMGLDNGIPGIVEALQLMNKGSRYSVWVHPKLGYGIQDSPDLPAGSLLIFDIEMVEIVSGGNK